MKQKTCSRCQKELDRPGRYCKKCHAAYMREWRKTHPLNKNQKIKDIARSYLSVYLKRGKIKRKSCEICGKHAEAHHPNYKKPLLVKWLCREHHLDLHRSVKRETYEKMIKSRHACRRVALAVGD